MIKKVIAALAVASAAVLAQGLALPTSADVLANPDCQNNHGYQTVVKTAPVIATDGSGARVGTVELCREGSLYFGFVIYNQAMTASQYAHGYLERYHNGGWVGIVACYDVAGGGNGRVEPGQRRCWTANLNGDSTAYTFVASSSQFSSHTGSLLASGATANAR